tara:strand:- start:1746 stop:3695 length:1950 start_codon:yes stop_codon:yes gene_type:complete
MIRPFPNSKKIGATPQPKTGARQTKANQDRAPENSKAPSGKLDKPQRIGQAGETVPIVFGKRDGGKGGVWVAPPLLKTGSSNFVSSLLFSISQGKIASTPDPINLWSGLTNQKLRIDSSMTLSHVYKTNAQLVATPTCPIAGDGLYCGIESFSYLEPVIDGSAANKKTRIRQGSKRDFYVGERVITRGTGDTDNSVYFATLKVFDNSTGNDVTSAYESALGFSPGVIYRFNTDLQNTPVQVGGIVDLTAAFGYGAPTTAFSSIGDGSGSFTFEYTVTSVNPRYNLSGNLDSPYALTGNQSEITLSIYANPDTSTITDFTNYADITFLKVVGNLFGEPELGSMPPDAKQAYIFYEQGVEVDLYSSGLSGGSYTVGASNQLVDLAMHLFKLLKRVDGANTADIAAPMNTSNMQAVAAFCTNYEILFNGIISARVNVAEYLTSVAPCFLLSFVNLGGQWQFRPLLPLNGSNQIDTTALTPVATFTEANILPGSFQKSYLAADERRDFVASVAYREATKTSIGVERTVKVRFSAADTDSPVEQFDLTEFCAIRNHAIIFAKHELARRKRSTHSISFQTPLLTTNLAPTDVIKVQRQRISSVGDNRTEVEWYQVTKVNHSSAGVSTVEAVHFPVNASSVSLISNDVLNGTFTVI